MPCKAKVTLEVAGLNVGVELLKSLDDRIMKFLSEELINALFFSLQIRVRVRVGVGVRVRVRVQCV